MNAAPSTDLARWMLRLGILLFLFGLLAGLVIPVMANPRMGLTSHLEGVINGTFLLVLGLMWTHLNLGTLAQRILFGIALYSSYANFLATFLAGLWGAGSAMMPIAGGDHSGTAIQEGLIAFALISLSVGMIVVSLMLLWGLRGRPALSSAPTASM